MQESGPPPHPQHLQDADHLRLLAIFHYVMAGLAMVGGFLLMAYFAFTGYIFSEMIRSVPPSSGPPPPPEFGWIFGAMGAVFCLVTWLMAVLLFLTGRWISARQNRIFCMVVAGIHCAAFPLGTALGVFTLIVLQRPTVRAQFEGVPEGAYLNR